MKLGAIFVSFCIVAVRAGLFDNARNRNGIEQVIDRIVANPLVGRAIIAQLAANGGQKKTNKRRLNHFLRRHQRQYQS